MAQVQILFIATKLGLAQLANPGTSDRWRAVGEAFTDQEVYAVCASATDPLHVVVGVASGLHVSRDGGASWNQEHAAHALALAAVDDGSFFAGTDSGDILHGDGEGWRHIHTASAPIINLNVLADNRVAAIARDGAIEIFSDGQWSKAGILAPGALEVVNSSQHPGDLYMAGARGLVTMRGTRAVEGKPTGALILLEGKPEVLLFGTNGPVQRSEDMCATTQAVEGPVDVRVFVSPPHYRDWVYAGTGGGELWFSRDRGRTWKKLYEGMAPVRDLSFVRVRS